MSKRPLLFEEHFSVTTGMRLASTRIATSTDTEPEAREMKKMAEIRFLPEI
jgi:hypothetical protein